jgi:hypothetical protein
MKTITVAVHIQMDIDENGNVVTEVQRVLDLMNQIVGMSELESSPQIFTENIDSTNILDMETEFDIGDAVEVPDPIDDDIHNHSFVGYIVSIVGDMATVEDGDGDFFDIELNRLEMV